MERCKQQGEEVVRQTDAGNKLYTKIYSITIRKPGGVCYTFKFSQMNVLFGL